MIYNSPSLTFKIKSKNVKVLNLNRVGFIGAVRRRDQQCSKNTLQFGASCCAGEEGCCGGGPVHSFSVCWNLSQPRADERGDALIMHRFSNWVTRVL